jgi:glucans biosynthesis protein
MPGSRAREAVAGAVVVLFELDPGNDTACELRLTLKAADQPLSETWLYRWIPGAGSRRGGGRQGVHR